MKIAKDLEARLERPLRVLHIGNIANNAYNNAVIQRKYGISADVVCYNYYHIMGCPEWETHEFGESVDDFFPNWWETSLKGWQRPDWFVQSTPELCTAYLVACHNNMEAAKSKIWILMQASYFLVLKKSSDAEIEVPAELSAPVYILDNERYELLDLGRADFSHESAMLQGEIMEAEKKASSRIRAILRPIWITARKAIATVYKGFTGTVRAILDYLFPEHNVVASLYRIKQRILSALVENFFRLKKDNENIVLKMLYSNRGEALPKTTFSRKRFNKIMDMENADTNTIISFSGYAEAVIKHLGPLMNYYDVVQGYSIDGIIPFLLQKDDFTTYEHGTLRSLHLERGFNGICIRHSYPNAKGAFITNTDVLGNARKLIPDREKIVPLPHAFNDEPINTFYINQTADGTFSKFDKLTFFSPTRQHWKTEPVSMQKGNDVFLNALGLLTPAERKEMDLKFVRWGDDVELTQQMLEKLGMSVEWLPRLNKKVLWEYFMKSHVVVDQFTTPAIGGVAFEAMALGSRLITNIDPVVMEDFFGKSPPCLPAATVEECYKQIRKVLEDPEDTNELGNQARDWANKYHSTERIVELQAQNYATFVTGQAAHNNPS